jgi:hypothetical protein
MTAPATAPPPTAAATTSGATMRRVFMQILRAKHRTEDALGVEAISARFLART